MKIIENNYYETMQATCPHCDSVLEYTEEDINKDGTLTCPCCKKPFKIGGGFFDDFEVHIAETADTDLLEAEISTMIEMLKGGDSHTAHCDDDDFIFVFKDVEEGCFSVYYAPLFFKAAFPINEVDEGYQD